jgi:hypothetical protein
MAELAGPHRKFDDIQQGQMTVLSLTSVCCRCVQLTYAEPATSQILICPYASGSPPTLSIGENEIGHSL